MLISIDEFLEFAEKDLDAEQTEQFSQAGSRVDIFSFDESQLGQDFSDEEKLLRYEKAANHFRQAGICCALLLQMDSFLHFASKSTNENLIKAFKEIGSEIEVMLNIGQANNCEEVLNFKQIVQFEKAAKRFANSGIKTVFCDAADINCRVTAEQAIAASKKVNGWIKEIKLAQVNGKRLSNFERFLYAYDIASQFSYAVEEAGQDALISRKLMYILNGDKLVCVGFASILKHLLNAVNIPCTAIALEPYQTKTDGHVTCLAYIKDTKYKLDGTFISDPTYGHPSKDFGQNVEYAVIAIKDANEVYGDRTELESDAMQWFKSVCFSSVYGFLTVDEKKYNRIEQAVLNNELAPFETDENGLNPQLTQALIQVALSKGMDEEQALRFALARQRGDKLD